VEERKEPGAVDVFDLDRSIVEDYARFARSFTLIRAPDIRSQVETFMELGGFGRNR
jgi:hypothetical protein